jgi:restriction system protein
MRKVEALSGKCTEEDYVAICDICGFWFGHGHKGWIKHRGPWTERGAVGLITHQQLDDLEVDTDALVSFLNENPRWLTHVNPFKAETLVCHLLEEAFGWEVKHLGGRRDGGADALAVRSSGSRAIVQVKWRQDTKRAESVNTVRELAGTLIARGVPHGLLVTTRGRLSKTGIAEADLIGRRHLGELGQLSIDWKAYSDILDMLEIAAVRIDARKRVPFESRSDGDFYIFDGGGVWDANWNYVESEEAAARVRDGDPYTLLSG